MRRFWTRCNFMRLVVACFLVGGLEPFATLRSVAATPLPAGSTTIEGIFTIIYGDPPPGSNGTGGTLYFVTDDQGVQTQLDISEAVLRAAGGVSALDRQRVTVVVTSAPSTLAQNGAAPVKTVSAISLADATQSGGTPSPITSPVAPTEIHVTSTTSTTVSFAWTPQDPTAGIALSNGAEMFDLGVAGSSYTQVALTPGSWVCISLAAYASSVVSSWTDWVCGQAL